LVQAFLKKWWVESDFKAPNLVVDNLKVTSYNVASRIIYEWGTCTGAIRRLKFEIVNIELKI
jgi:hypothetical protein